MADEVVNVTKLLQVVVEGLVKRPDRVVVTVIEAEDVVHLGVFVEMEDMGRVVGRSGRTMNALRTVVQALGRTTGTRYELNVNERGGK